MTNASGITLGRMPTDVTEAFQRVDGLRGEVSQNEADPPKSQDRPDGTGRSSMSAGGTRAGLNPDADILDLRGDRADARGVQ